MKRRIEFLLICTLLLFITCTTNASSFTALDFVGVWHPTVYDGSMTLLGDGSGFYHDTEFDYLVKWDYHDETITIIYPGNIPSDFTVLSESGELSITSADGSITLVKDNDAEIDKNMLLIPELENTSALNYDGEEFSLLYDHCERVRMSDGTVAVMLVFDFINKYQEATSFFNTVDVHCFQNGIEVFLPSVSYNEYGLGDAWEYSENALKHMLQGGSLKVGTMIPIGDASPIIIQMDEKRYWGPGVWNAEGTLVFEDPSGKLIDNDEEVSILDNIESEIENNMVYNDADIVKKVQETLNEKGYDCGMPDGINGIKTENAIIEYRINNTLRETKEIDDELLKSLGL